MFGFRSRRQRAESSFLQGTAALDRGDHDLALCWFADAVRIDRRFAPGHIGLGLARLRKGEFAAAISPLSEAIRLSEDPRAYFLRSLCYRGIGDPVREETDFCEARRRDPRVEESMRVPSACNQAHHPSREHRQSCSCVQHRASVLAV